MTDPRTPDSAADHAASPAPRRTRSGAVVVGPTLRARYLPAALIGLPLVSVLLSTFAAAGIQQWRTTRVRAGQDGMLEALLEPAGVQLLLGALALWVLFSLWALFPLILTHRVVLLDEQAGTLALRKGLRVADRARLSQVRYATGDAERGGMALIGIEPRGIEPPGIETRGTGTSAGAETIRQWVVPESGWDDAAFDGLRTLQAAVDLPPAPPRAVLVRENRRARRERARRELAARLGMPWREEYAHDEAAFRAEFDRVRRVLGGKERPRDGDPRP